MQPTVLITSENFGRFSQEGRHVLEEAGLRIIDNPYGHTFLHREQILPIVGEADGIICDMEKIDREVIDAAPRLKVIARRGVGIDSVDWRYAQSKGIEVARTTGVVERPVAELEMGYILEFSRHISAMSSAITLGGGSAFPAIAWPGIRRESWAWATSPGKSPAGPPLLICASCITAIAGTSGRKRRFGAQYAPLENAAGRSGFRFAARAIDRGNPAYDGRAGACLHEEGRVFDQYGARRCGGRAGVGGCPAFRAAWRRGDRCV